VSHQLYFRLHETRKSDPNLPAGRTLFVLNVPVDATLAHFERLFRRCGTIQNVLFKNRADQMEAFPDFKPREPLRDYLKSGAKAHIVFEDEDGAERALAMKTRKRVWSDQPDESLDPSQIPVQAPIGISSMNSLTHYPLKQKSLTLCVTEWVSDYLLSIPDAADLEELVNQDLLDFEDMEERMRREALSKRNMPDADGFVTVTRARGRRNTNKDGAGGSATAVSAELVKDLKPKDHTLVDFYRFQMRENKRNQLADLRRKFEEDKLKIEDLKKKRKFKPF
jgi:ribosomal RNA-processing protein 7